MDLTMLHRTTLEIQQRENQGIVVLGLRGKLEMGDGDLILREYVEPLLANGNRLLALDLKHVSAIDTAGSGLLLYLAQQYGAAAGRMVLFHLDPAQAKIYELARLEAVVEIYNDEIDAINSFFPDRATPHYDILEYVESQAAHEDQDDKK